MNETHLGPRHGPRKEVTGRFLVLSFHSSHDLRIWIFDLTDECFLTRERDIITRRQVLSCFAFPTNSKNGGRALPADDGWIACLVFD